MTAMFWCQCQNKHGLSALANTFCAVTTSQILTEDCGLHATLYDNTEMAMWAAIRACARGLSAQHSMPRTSARESFSHAYVL